MSKLRARAAFAARLKAKRVAAGLSQEQLGIRAGIPEDVARTRVNRYERSVHDADLDTAQRIADSLEIPLAALYAESEIMAAAIEAFARLPLTEQLRAAEDLAAKVTAGSPHRLD